MELVSDLWCIDPGQETGRDCLPIAGVVDAMRVPTNESQNASTASAVVSRIATIHKARIALLAPSDSSRMSRGVTVDAPEGEAVLNAKSTT